VGEEIKGIRGSDRQREKGKSDTCRKEGGAKANSITAGQR